MIGNFSGEIHFEYVANYIKFFRKEGQNMKKIKKTAENAAQTLVAFAEHCNCKYCNECSTTSTQALDFAYNYNTMHNGTYLSSH